VNVWMESWDYVDTATQRVSLVGGTLPTVVSAVGRRGTRALQGSAADAYAGYALAASGTTLTVGVAVASYAPPSGPYGKLVGVGHMAASGAEHVCAAVLPDGSLGLFHGDGVGLTVGDVLALSPPGVMRFDGSYQYVELHAEISASGTLEARIGTETIIRLQEVATQASGVGVTPDVVWLYPQEERRYDDAYANDAQGDRNTGFAGNVRITADFPVGDGVSSDWLPQPVQANYRNVAQPVPDDDTSYNHTDSAGARDQFQMPPLRDRGAGVLALEVLVRAKKALPAGDVPVNASVRSGTTYDGPTVLVGSGYGYLATTYETDPLTSSGWMDEAIDVAQLGYRREY
jgi:hypothetical protein